MQHRADIRWTAKGDVARGQYSRAHSWSFDGGLTVPGSASPDIVPAPYSDAAAVDPEEAFVASVASCHMLWFLDLARRAGHVPQSYHDAAVGQMSRSSEGKMWIDRITLNICVVWADDAPDRAAHEALHHAAHEACFIANSIRTDIVTNIIEG